MDHAKKLQRWIDAALSRRASASSTEAIFYTHLVEGERGACPWQQAGFASFDDVLHKFQLADVMRYRRFYSATLMFGAAGTKLAQSLGIDAVVVGSHITNEDQRDQFIRKIKELVASRPHSAPLTLEEIRKVRRDVAPKTKTRTDRPQSIGLPESVRLDLEKLVVDLRKLGGSVYASGLALQFIRDGIERCRREMIAKSKGKAA